MDASSDWILKVLSLVTCALNSNTEYLETHDIVIFEMGRSNNLLNYSFFYIFFKPVKKKIVEMGFNKSILKGA